MACALHETESVTVYVPHSTKCERETGRQDRNQAKCQCRKWLHIFEEGKGLRASAKTRSWKEAERKALAERIQIDPVEIEKRRLAGTAETSAETLEAALKQWVNGFKNQSGSTSKSYKYFVIKVTAWGEREGINHLSDMTVDQKNHISCLLPLALSVPTERRLQDF